MNIHYPKLHATHWDSEPYRHSFKVNPKKFVHT